MKKGIKLAAFWLRLVSFVLVLTVLMVCTLYVLVPKHDYGICPLTTYYTQPEDSVDVLVLGTSLGYAGVNGNILFEEYGIATYSLCTAEQSYWLSYHYLEEALKTQTPKLILLDAKASMYTSDYTTLNRTVQATMAIRDLDVRLRAIRACVAEEDFLSIALGFPQLHSQYRALDENSFVFPPNNGGRGPNWKGYIEYEKTDPKEKPSLVWTSTKKPMNARQEEWFRKLLELAAEHEVPVLIVGFPCPDYANDHMYYNSLWAIADEYGVAHINYNDPDLRLRMLYSSDFADWQHMNVKGSATFSRRLGSDLKEMYDLPDRRGDETYITWQLCADEWFEKYPDYKLSENKEEAV